MAKKKEMNRTSGTAKRKVDTAGKLLTSKEVGTAIKKGGPLTGSASGVKSISLKDAGEVLTQGIVTLGKKGLKFAPEGLAMALPVGKVAKAAGALRAAGKLNTAAMLEARVSAKLIGQGKRGAGTMLDVLTGKEARRFSKSVFPRAKFGPNPMKATPEMQSVANKITQRHYADVTKKGLGHAEAVDMNRAKVLRNLASKRGVDLGVAKASVKRRGK